VTLETYVLVGHPADQILVFTHATCAVLVVRTR
jgi:hypothetical protein